MLKHIIIVIAGVIILVAVYGAWNAYDNNTVQPETDSATTTSPILDAQPEAAEIRNVIVVERPLIDEQVSSPLTVIGDARGTWYFEATAPMRLEDANGNVIAQGFVTAQGEWMTEDFVPFEGTLTFSAPATDTGTVVLERSNPSGLPENAQELRISVRFR